MGMTTNLFNAKKKWIFLFFCFLASFCSISYEILLLKLVDYYLEDVLFWECFTIGFFVFSSGLGVFFFQTCRNKNIEKIFYIEVLLSLFGILLVPLFLLFTFIARVYIYNYRYFDDSTAFFFQIVPFSVVIFSCLFGFFSGLEMSILFNVAEKVFNKSYFAISSFFYYLGSLIASLCFLFFLTCGLVNYEISQFSAMCNSFLVLLILILSNKKSIYKYFCFIFLLFLQVFYIKSMPSFYQFHLKNFYYNKAKWGQSNNGKFFISPVGFSQLLNVIKKLPEVETIITPYQKIDKVTNISSYTLQDKSEGDITRLINQTFTLYLNSHFQFNTRNEKDYHQYMAHMPVMLTRHKNTPNILVLGAGDGLLVREILKNKSIESITLVELDPKMISLATKFPLVQLNNYSLSDERVSIINADAFYWVKKNKRKFDAVYIDFPFPHSFDILRLYSSEFLRMVKMSLKTEESFLIMDIPFQSKKSRLLVDNKVLIGSFQKAGFSNIIVFHSRFDTFLLTRKSLKDYSLTYFDLGFPTEKINTRWFQEKSNYQIFKGSHMLSFENSIMRPKKIIHFDPMF
tara:strand:+ start:587 stop:2299 length:1713 start_codon:yes stop_codon:yes gene_type:complete